MKIHSFRAHEADIERWREEAKREGITLGVWIRNRLNGPIAPRLATLPTTLLTKVEHVGKCEHRIPLGSYCKSCGKIKR